MVCHGQHSQYTIEDFFDLLFPDDNGVLCMVYNSFLDDSKDAQQSKMFVSAGFFAEKDDWRSLRVAWRKVLDDAGIEYYKSSEYNHLCGQFERFRTDQYPPPSGRKAAKQIKDALQEVVRQHPSIGGLGIAVLVEDYEKVRARPEAAKLFGPNPYHRALESIMFETVKIVRRARGHNMVAFVHDEESDFDQLHQLYLGFKKLNPRTARLMGGFAPLSDKEHPPLQMADMIANHTLEIGLERINSGKPLDQAKLKMRENIHLLGVWNEDYMLSVLKYNLMRKGQPIPFDLESDKY